MWSYSLGLVTCLLLCCHVSQAEIYSSADKILQLEDVEKEMVIATRSFLAQQQVQLDEYRSFVARVRQEHEVALDQGDEFWEHPLNVFRLTKRILQDWAVIEMQLNENHVKKEFDESVLQLRKEFLHVKKDDLQGSARGVVRLQDIYNITAKDFADGYLNGVATGAVFLWRDCYEVGVQLYEQGLYSAALEWFNVAGNMLSEDELEVVNQYAPEIYEYLALTHLQLGEKDHASQMLSELLSDNPMHAAAHTLNYVEQKEPKCLREGRKFDWEENYRTLCQGKSLSGAAPKDNSLSCYLDAKRNTIFQLAPLQVEQVHRNPDIFIYYNVLSDGHIQRLLEVAEGGNKFRSSVAGGSVSDVRVSQQVWLQYTTPILESISKLVGSITGLDMSNAEQMQVAEYGIGGHYSPHFDYLHALRNEYVERGNRLATVMFYLSDVAQGGYTVFPKLNVHLKPIKGAMVMWYNELRNLNNDVRTQHAGCPILEGAKRIGNIWIHSSMQEFRRPCTLNKNE